MCGTKCKWIITSEGLLIIYGEGEMNDYEIDNQPWNQYKQIINEITILRGITRIGKNSFNGIENLMGLIITDGVESIGEYAISDCSSLIDLLLPSTLKTIENYGISYCESVENRTRAPAVLVYK